MQNQNSEDTAALESAAPAADVMTAAKRPRRRAADHARTRFVLAAGAVVALGAMVGTGFAVQSAFAAQGDRVAETRALTNASNLDVDQLAAHSTVLEARAEKTATDTVAAADGVIASANGKADASALAASVAELGGYRTLTPAKVFALAKSTAAQTETVRAQVAEFDRVAAEQAAAAAAAAQAAADAAAEAAQSQRSSSSSSSGGSRPTAPANPSGAQAIAHDLMASLYGWGDDQFGCLVELWNHESGWNVYAANSSGAYGIPQALPGSKMSSAGPDWQNSADTQIRWGLGYISGRYGTPCGAWDSFSSKGWY